MVCIGSVTAKEVRELTVERMQSLGVYRAEYDGIIGIYAQLCEQYDELQQRLKKSGYRVQTRSAQGGMKKSPIVATLESLRKDILAYSDRLCLNPKSFDALGAAEKAPKRSRLAEALEACQNDSRQHDDG